MVRASIAGDPGSAAVTSTPNLRGLKRSFIITARGLVGGLPHLHGCGWARLPSEAGGAAVLSRLAWAGRPGRGSRTRVGPMGDTLCAASACGVGLPPAWRSQEQAFSKTDCGSRRPPGPGPDTSTESPQLRSMVRDVTDRPRVTSWGEGRQSLWPSLIFCSHDPRKLTVYQMLLHRLFTPLKPQRILGGRCYHRPILQARK